MDVPRFSRKLSITPESRIRRPVGNRDPDTDPVSLAAPLATRELSIVR